MELPPTIFIALAVIIAALITGGITLVNLIIAKDQKTSEFRQDWINRLRDDIALFVGYAAKYSAYLHVRQGKLDDPATHEATLEEIIEYLKLDLDKHVQAFTRIKLYLNPKDDSEIIEKVGELRNLYEDMAYNLRDANKVGNLTDELVALMQTLLKKEWKRVKRGEPSFFLTKYAALSIIVTVLLLGFSYQKELTITMHSIFQSTNLDHMEECIDEPAVRQNGEGITLREGI